MDTDSSYEEEITTLPMISNLARDESYCPSEDDIDPTDSEMYVQEPVTLPTTNTSSHGMNVSFLCNPNDEELCLRQPRVSVLFDENLSSVQKLSWAKDSTCEKFYPTYK